MTTPQNTQIPEDLELNIAVDGATFARKKTSNFNRGLDLQDGYIAGATHYAALLVEEREKAMRWVRITSEDTLPPGIAGKQYICRFQFSDNLGKPMAIGIALWTRTEIEEECQGSDWFEWLYDPTTPQALKEGDKTEKR